MTTNERVLDALRERAGECDVSLRDIFAALAMHQFLYEATLPTDDDRKQWFPFVARIAYEMADAMLTERAK